MKQDIAWVTLRSYGIGKKLTKILREVGERSQAAVMVGHDIGNWFQTSTGTRQGDPLSPNIFIIYLERMMDGIHGNGSGIYGSDNTRREIKQPEICR